MIIRATTPDDDQPIWDILRPAIRAGETYALPRDMARGEALDWFHTPGHRTFVAAEDETVLGCYFYRPNGRGGAAHVANAAYATHPEARGRGVASAMCAHSLDAARAEGFRAMQFNFVIATNPAVRLWQKHGFDSVGTLPGAFDHPTLGEVDARVMYRKL
jgi:L-amino acid N-acyltransferase YncA